MVYGLLLQNTKDFESRAMACKVEKFCPSPSPQPESVTERQIYRCCNPAIELLETDEDCNGESDKADVVLNLCPGRSELNVSINGTTLDVNKSSLNATIGNFCVSINFIDRKRSLKPSNVAIVSASLRKPLIIVLGDFPYVTAAVSFSKHACY